MFAFTQIVKKPHVIFFYVQICNKKFMEKGGLQRHVKIHSDERAHVCHLCGKAFAVVR